MTGDSSAGLYPRYCLHLSPTFNNWCLLHVTDIHALRSVPGFEVQDFYFYKNLPIKWVRIVGIVVAVEDIAGRRIYTVDDSSGACIECVVALKAPPRETAPATAVDPWQAPVRPQPQPPADCVDVDVGSTVDIKGGLTTFRDEMQVKIEKVKILGSTEQEVALWERRARFRKEVLLEPWVLSEKQIRRCKKEETREKGGDDDKERKRKKEKQREERKREAERAERRRREKEAADKAAADKAAADRAAAETHTLDRYHLYQLRRRKQLAEERRAASSDALRRRVLDESLRGKYSALGL